MSEEDILRSNLKKLRLARANRLPVVVESLAEWWAPPEETGVERSDRESESNPELSGPTASLTQDQTTTYERLQQTRGGVNF